MRSGNDRGGCSEHQSGTGNRCRCRAHAWRHLFAPGACIACLSQIGHSTILGAGIKALGLQHRCHRPGPTPPRTSNEYRHIKRLKHLPWRPDPADLVMQHSTAVLIVGALTALGACSLPRESCAPADHASSLPAAVVAYLCADACRIALLNADPLPYHAGAPASAAADGSFLICFEQRTDGHWTARASGRLCANRSSDLAHVMTVEWLPATELRGFNNPCAALRILVTPEADGCRVTSDIAGIVPDNVLLHLAQTLRFSERLLQAEQLPPCCSQHSRWLSVPWLRRASHCEEIGELIDARRALHSARSFDQGLPGIDYRIGQLDAALGQDEAAEKRLRAAAFASADPGLRAAAALRAADSLARLDSSVRGQRLRRDAHRRLTAGDTASARALALQAEAEAPEPTADLRLRHRLQLILADARGALGTALLLREYEPTQSADQLLAIDLGRVGCIELAKRAESRVTGRALPSAELFAALSNYGDFENATYPDRLKATLPLQSPLHKPPAATPNAAPIR